jgi:hypothetical protein
MDIAAVWHAAGKTAEGQAFGWRERNHPWADQVQAVVKAGRCLNNPLGPCRSWSRNSLAQIHAQKEPLVSPVGTGAEYRLPRRVSS